MIHRGVRYLLDNCLNLMGAAMVLRLLWQILTREL